MSVDRPRECGPALPLAGGVTVVSGAPATDVPPGAQRLSLAAGECCTLPAGSRWRLLAGLMGLLPGPAAPAQPMALLGPGHGLASGETCVLLALQPVTALVLGGPTAQAAALPGGWRTEARTLQWLQWQTAQWALCGQHHSALARAASWSLLASACAGPWTQAADGPGLPPAQRPPLHWQAELLRRGLGLEARDFAHIRQALSAAGAWQEEWSSAAVTSARSAADLAARAPSDAGVPLRAQPAALQRLACGCHRQLFTAWQASATASATLMPSTPADKMPPA